MIAFRSCLAATAALLAAGSMAPPQQRHAQPKTHLAIFVTSDCPISNYYAPEIQEICSVYQPRGLTCTLIYEDVGLDEARMRAHLAEYGYRGIPASIDRDRTLARRAGASVTPQAVLYDADGRIRYRGRIDNRYEAFGKPRRVVTEQNLRDAIDAVLAGGPVPAPETPALGCHIAFLNPERMVP
jgi:hypothetical protein